jgi:hypothetical protein
VHPDPNEINLMMEDILQNVEIILDGENAFWPNQGVQTLTHWNANSGYIIKVSDLSELNLIGFPCEFSDFDFHNGWNLFPVFSQQNITTTFMIQVIPSQVELIKEISGNKVWWPTEGIFTLSILEPGKAYWVKISNQ